MVYICVDWRRRIMQGSCQMDWLPANCLGQAAWNGHLVSLPALTSAATGPPRCHRVPMSYWQACQAGHISCP